MLKKVLLCWALILLVASACFFGQDEMTYYEEHYKAHLEKVSEKIRQEIISHLQSKIKDFSINEELSEKLKSYVAACSSYEDINAFAFTKDNGVNYSKIWAIKGKVFSQKDISEKLDKYSTLFQNLNSLKDIQLMLSMTGELEKGFIFVLVFYTP